VQKAHLIFTSCYKEIVLVISYEYDLCCSNNVIQTFTGHIFHLGIYIMQATKMKIVQERKWHMKCVVFCFVVLVFQLTEKHRKHLQERLGTALEKYIHLFELTIMLE